MLTINGMELNVSNVLISKKATGILINALMLLILME